ncbi:hypothetical protein V6N12_065866 [Hibiscus sabdariffa]|uniref:HMA domain-containing protein n=1 Tax=Hibiscus sabdariffa TaxID=183260 RepID=A0ABR2AGG3_9ROSI
MVVRKIEVQDVDVKDGEAIILESSSVSLAGATSSSSDDQIEGLPAPIKDESMDISVSLHETEEVTKTLHHLSVTLPLVEKASTVVDAITSTAAKFSLHDIFQKFRVGGMTCVACVGSVEGIWRNLPGASRKIEHADFGSSLVQKFLKNLKRSFPKLSIQGLCLIGVKE